ncbi:ATP phosphoribosyltransferase [Actinomarinicola tropica]|uniref:ATP phosphoribosyltransferase n=1 Tax=Actinomarinicola tropica TaxID=2789776 RepID=A0A5Q2RPH2_9ACTN|nr:ATP phosphoribosyltransferase [Actinomarinicola tropica]QGG96852.1 ATP phosphoribosyltransferase [Actinomarinicola tropica]
MTTRVGLPSRGRLRDEVLRLLDHAGFTVSAFRGSDARATIEGVEFIEMRPRDAAAWLRAGRLTAAFISTDIALEYDLADWPAADLGFARSDLVLAARDDDPRREAADFAGGVVATHMPNVTERWFAARDIDVTVVPMGGALEGVCAAGMADAIVDLRETGASLARNRLRVVAEMERCQARFVRSDDSAGILTDLELRIGAALDARKRQYLLLHVPPDRLDALTELFHGLASPTVMPLAERDDLVAAHLVVERSDLWAKLGALRELGATGIVALPTDAVLP